MTLAARLPAFTWDRIAPLAEKAGLHPDGPVDLSMGTPVDPVPDLIRAALAEASNAPGYPATWRSRGCVPRRPDGSRARTGFAYHRMTCCPWSAPRSSSRGFRSRSGSRPGDVVVHPELAYPTYDIGARLAGASAVASDSLLGVLVLGRRESGWCG